MTDHPVTPRPAATVVVFRQRTLSGAPALEVLLVRRHEQAPFMGGAWVFPGGRVDGTDRLTDPRRWCDGLDRLGDTFPDLDVEATLSYQVAAIRELFEETGVLLAREPGGQRLAPAREARLAGLRQRVSTRGESLTTLLRETGWRLALDLLTPLAHWVTPEITTRRYDTRFFLAALPDGQTPSHDTTETIDSAWLTPAEALARAAADEIVLPPPTWCTLQELQPFATVEETLTWARSRRIVRRAHRLVEDGARKLLVLPGDPLHPEPVGDQESGAHRFVLVDGVWKPDRYAERM